MPKYLYECGPCAHQFVSFHGIHESPSGCPKCQNKKDLTKLINKVHIKGRQEGVGDPTFNKVGDLTKQMIEDNREILKDLKEEAGSLIYDDVADISE